MDEESSEEGLLTALGRRQALCIAKRLSEFPIDVIYHSDFERAVETAKIIAKYLPRRPLYSKRCLREGIPSLPKVLLKGNESTKEERSKARARMESAIKTFFAPNRRKADRHELLVTHGNLIRYLVRRAVLALSSVHVIMRPPGNHGEVRQGRVPT